MREISGLDIPGYEHPVWIGYEVKNSLFLWK